jgi:hypothetical protein
MWLVRYYTALGPIGKVRQMKIQPSIASWGDSPVKPLDFYFINVLLIL